MIYNDAGRLYQLAERQVKLAEYLYNDMGQRIGKTVYQQDGITVDNITLYHYDQMGRLISETTEAGQAIKDYVYTGMLPVAQIDVGRADDLSVPPSTTETINYLYGDHLMTTRLASDQRQAIIWRWQGEAFGNTPAIELATISINLRFPGQYYDSETNLHYNHYRYYDPSLGRYITSDPIGLKGGMNSYLYAVANPIRFIDPFGLETTLITTYDYGIGSHSALHVKNANETFLYDPGGSYRGETPRGSGDGFSDSDANLDAYVKYQKSTGSSVSLQSLNTDIATETEIINRAIEQGGRMPLYCAAAVSGALGGACGVEGSFFPGKLEDIVKQVIDAAKNKEGVQACE